MQYRHQIDQQKSELPVGKVVCVGRNYAAHAKELNNPVPDEPVLFLKPATALVTMSNSIVIPKQMGSCHFETELAILIGQRLSRGCTEQQAQQAIVGCLLYTSPSPRDMRRSRMPSSA